ncbi:MAG: radical SAM protein [Planctomycetaceae bacterium]|nr:B12-binding domain-containing radical SAM protein [Planctomycetaceae bacterium]
MKFKFVLPSLMEASGVCKKGVKYYRFPPLGLATLAAYLPPQTPIDLQDEHVEKLNLDDSPDVVVIQAYISSAYHAYQIADHYRAKGAHVCLGGLHPTSLPREASEHADSVFLGPGEDTWPRFLHDLAAGRPRRIYRSTHRCLVGMPSLRRDLIKRHLYLVPNTLVVSRGCPHHCQFCYKDAFYRGGPSFYTMRVDQALAEIQSLPGRHVCFLDDNLFGDVDFAQRLFDGMKGMGRVWLGAGTVQAILNRPDVIRKAADAGMRSLFIGFETLSEANLRSVGKLHNVHRDYNAAIRLLHDLGVMVNASFVFGMDGDDESVFARTLDWSVSQGIESATFHILTPYPGTGCSSGWSVKGVC